MIRTIIGMCTILLAHATGHCETRPGTVPAIGLHHNTPDVFAITQVRLIVSPEEVLEQGTLVVRDGLVVDAGVGAKIPADATVLDFSGCTVYPGFIELSTNIGLTNDNGSDAEAGARHWNRLIRSDRIAADLYAPDKDSLDVLRKNGFTVAVTCPHNGVLTGWGSLVALVDGIPAAAVIENNVLQGASFGTASGTYPAAVQGSIAMLRQSLYDAGWYRDAWKTYNDHPDDNIQPESNQSLESLRAVIDGEKPLLLFGHNLLDMFNVDDVAEEFGLTYIYRGLVMNTAGWMSLKTPVRG